MINRRSDDEVCPPETHWVIADGALRIIGWDGDFAALRQRSATRLAPPREEPAVTG